MCCVHWKWECGRQVLPPTPSKSSWDAHASSASQTRSIFSQEEEERLNYLQPLPTRDWKAAALVKKSFQLIDFSPWQPSQPEHSRQHLLAPPPFAITFSSLPPSCVLSLSQESPFFHLEVCVVCTVILLHQVCACTCMCTPHTRKMDWQTPSPFARRRRNGGRWSRSFLLPSRFQFAPCKVRKCEDGDLDRSAAVVSSSLPICLLLRESRVSGFASKGPALPGRPATEREKKSAIIPFRSYEHSLLLRCTVFFFFPHPPPDVFLKQSPPLCALAAGEVEPRQKRRQKAPEELLLPPSSLDSQVTSATPPYVHKYLHMGKGTTK